MRYHKYKIVLTILCSVASSLSAASYRIAFGSCFDQEKSSNGVFEAIADAKPNLFIFTGDNLYIDSPKPEKFARDYGLLASDQGFATLRKQTNVMAIWDDHDYGSNDGGKEFHAKQIAKQYFIDFFDYAELRQIPKTHGIEHVRRVPVGDKIIQIIMLDTRWYRDELLRNNLSENTQEAFQLGSYRPHLDTSKTLLGKSQWLWLEEQLKKPADLNIIVSSIQLLAEFTAWETWANFPHERSRILKLIEQYSPGKTIILSGDVHRSETSKLEMGDWSLFELTASGLNADMYPEKPNIHRIGQVVIEHNFGMLDINFKAEGSIIESGYYDTQGKPLDTVNLLNSH